MLIGGSSTSDSWSDYGFGSELIIFSFLRELPNARSARFRLDGRVVI